ncbi:putative ribonuclease H-like domain-containing protein [Tanacetum coccineum]
MTTPPRMRLLLTTPMTECRGWKRVPVVVLRRKTRPTTGHKISSQITVCRTLMVDPVYSTDITVPRRITLVRDEIEGIEESEACMRREVIQNRLGSVQCCDDLELKHIMRTHRLEVESTLVGHTCEDTSSRFLDLRTGDEGSAKVSFVVGEYCIGPKPETSLGKQEENLEEHLCNLRVVKKEDVLKEFMWALARMRTPLKIGISKCTILDYLKESDGFSCLPADASKKGLAIVELQCHGFRKMNLVLDVCMSALSGKSLTEIDPKFPDRVFKVEKALYDLHQALRAWYETLSTYLLDNGFQRGQIDKTVFIKRVKGYILLVQVYVDDIIFRSTKKSLCTEFEKLMHKKFQMSSMGELTFFLGLQVTQKDDGIFISQDKYVDEILKKFGFLTVKTASTPMETLKSLMKDENAEDVDVHLYRSMIGSLMYLTSSRPDIMFVVCACARFQVTPKVSHLHAVKRIFRYLKGQPKWAFVDYDGASLDRKSTIGGCRFLRRRLILWQCKKQIVVANSTTEAEYVAASSCCGQVLWIQNQLLDYGYNFMNTKIFIDNESIICIVKNLVFHSKTKHIEIRHHFIRDSYEKRLIQVIKIHTDHNVADLLTKAFDTDDWNGLEMLRMKLGLKLVTQKVNAVGHYLVLLGEKQGKEFSRTVTPLFATMLIQPQADVDETIYEERGDSMERAATTAASLYAEQDSGNIIRTQSIATLNEPIPQGTGSGSGPKRQDTILGDRPAQTRNIVESDQDEEISFFQEDAETQGRYDQDFNATTVSAPITTTGVSVSTAEPSTPPTTATVIEDEDLIIAQILMKMRSEKLKEKAKERGSKEKSSEPATRPIRGVTIQEPKKPLKKKDQIKFDEEVAKRLAKELEVELEEEERADYELAQRLQAEEQGELTIEERSRLFIELMDKRKKHFAKLRAEKIRRKPPTKA